MFLFFVNAEDAFRSMLDGYRNGVIAEKRLQEALERVLGLKASLGLHTTPREALVPGPGAQAAIGCPSGRALVESGGGWFNWAGVPVPIAAGEGCDDARPGCRAARVRREECESGSSA